MRIVLPMLAMLVAGLALGGGGSTLYCSGQMTRQFKAQAEWKGLVDKQTVTIREQSEALRKLTAATDQFFEAKRANDAARSR